MAASGLGNADASVMEIGFFCGSATFNNVAGGGIEFSGIGVHDKLTTAIDWPRWIEMEGAAFLASSANFSGNGGSIIFSDNYVRQHFQDGAEGAGYGAPVSLGGSTTYVQEGAYITLLGDDNHLGFEGVGELLLQTDLAYTLGANGRKEFILFDGVESFFAADSFHFTVAGYEGETTYVEHRVGAVYVYVVPEPATATLSMLALSLLMLRRRRS